MKTFVEFRSSKFPPYDGEENEINEGIWGKRLAEYLVQNLRAQGITVDEFFTEDWGYYIPVMNETGKLALCCSHQGGEKDQFICFTDPKKPIVKKLFRSVDMTKEMDELLTALRRTLEGDPDIQQIEWHEP